MKQIFLLWCFLSALAAEKHLKDPESVETSLADEETTSDTKPSVWQNYFNWKQWQDETNKKYENPTTAGLEDWKQWNQDKSSEYSDWGKYTAWQQSQPAPQSSRHGGSASSNPSWTNWQSYISSQSRDANAANDWVKEYGSGSEGDFKWNKYANKYGTKKEKAGSSDSDGDSGGYDWSHWVNGPNDVSNPSNDDANKYGDNEAKSNTGDYDWSRWMNKYGSNGPKDDEPQKKHKKKKVVAAFANVEEALSNIEKMDDNTLARHYQQYGNWKDWMKHHEQEAPQGDSFQNWLMWKQSMGVEGSGASWANLQSYKNYLESRESYAVMADDIVTFEAMSKNHHKRHKDKKDKKDKEDKEEEEPEKSETGPTGPPDWRSNVPPEYRNFTDWQKYIPEDYRNFTAGAGGNPGTSGGAAGDHPENGDWRGFIPKKYQDMNAASTEDKDTEASHSPTSDGSGQISPEDMEKYPWLRYVPEAYRKQALKDTQKKEEKKKEKEDVKDKKPSQKHHKERMEEMETDSASSGGASPTSFSAVSDIDSSKFSTNAIAIFFGLLILGAAAVATTYYCIQIRKRSDYEDVDRLLLI